MTDIKYYSYDNDDGFEEFETEEQAKAAADELMSCRDEFDDDDEIEYGVMIPLGRLTETNRRDTPENQEEADWWETNKWAYVCDHEIATVTTTNDLYRENIGLRVECGKANDELRDLRAQLAEANRTIEALRNTVIEQNQDRSRVACLNGDKDKEIRALKYEAEILRNQMKLRDESRIETYRELCAARQELEEMSEK